MKTKSKQEVKINYDHLQYGIIADDKVVALFEDEQHRNCAIGELEMVFPDMTFVEVNLKER